MPFSLAPCWKKPFSEQLSPVHVNPDRKNKTGTFAPDFRACGGRNILRAMSVVVLDDLCFSFRSLPPKEAIVAVVWNAMVVID
jgi:hypothetical protein